MSDYKTTKMQQLSALTASEVFNGNGFGELFEADKNRLYCYIYAYVHDTSWADDIFQEVSLTLWKEFDKFEQGSSFSKWANTIAFNRIRVYRRKQNKYQVGLSDDFLQELMENLANIESYSQPKEERVKLLEHCQTLLSAPLKNIYELFYVKRLKAQDIADDTGRSIHAIRKSIYKLRKYLFNCVESKFEKGSE